MPSIFDLLPTPYEPDILDPVLRRLVWYCNTHGHLTSELPKRGREEPPEEYSDYGTPMSDLTTASRGVRVLP
jgi:hypothetical protein